MLDPMVSLAFALHARKGAYAVLLGSGVSSSAGILTGWGITLDLVRQVAAVESKDCEPDPESWFRTEHETEPNYDELLAALAKTPDERQALLRGFFEPTDAEREQGVKQPTSAHKAIALLVRAGYIRVIVTTNFDRLMETALEEEGVYPDVVSTEDQIRGATPLSQVKCLVIKVHGDYRDVRIRNTPDELAKYDPAMDALLDRVFDEFGVIVSGWSAIWDPALRASIERCPSRRYTLYWTDRQPPRDEAERLIRSRGGEFIQIESADRFFEDLAGKVLALDDLTTRHPMSSDLAAAEVKRFIVDDRHCIRLADLVREETERVYRTAFDQSAFPLSNKEVANLGVQIHRYDKVTNVLASIFSTGCFWGDHRHHRLWVDCLSRLGSPPSPAGQYVDEAEKIRHYPALRLLYVGGIAALASENYITLLALLTQPRARERFNTDLESLADVVYPSGLIHPETAGEALGLQQKNNLPLNEHLKDVTRFHLDEYIVDRGHYDAIFDRFEYLHGLLATGIEEGSSSGPIGLYGIIHQGRLREKYFHQMAAEVERDGDSWPLLRAGLFQGSLDTLMTVQRRFHGSWKNHYL